MLHANGLKHRVLAITTDNASNNHTMVKALEDTLWAELRQPAILDIALTPVLAPLVKSQVHIPCLAHVLQLSLKAMLISLNTYAKNDEVVSTWEETVDAEFTEEGIPLTLEKVCSNIC